MSAGTAALAGTDVVGPLVAAVAPALRTALIGGGGLAIGIGAVVWSMRKTWDLFKDLVADKHVRNMTWDRAGSQEIARGEYVPANIVYDEDSSSSWGSQSVAEQDSAAISYLDRYRGTA